MSIIFGAIVVHLTVICIGIQAIKKINSATSINYFTISENKATAKGFSVLSTIILTGTLALVLAFPPERNERGIILIVSALFMVPQWYFIVRTRLRRVEINENRIIYTNTFGRKRETRFDFIDEIEVSIGGSNATIYVGNKRFVVLNAGLVGMNNFFERCVKENIKIAKKQEKKMIYTGSLGNTYDFDIRGFGQKNNLEEDCEILLRTLQILSKDNIVFIIANSKYFEPVESSAILFKSNAFVGKYVIGYQIDVERLEHLELSNLNGFHMFSFGILYVFKSTMEWDDFLKIKKWSLKYLFKEKGLVSAIYFDRWAQASMVFRKDDVNSILSAYDQFKPYGYKIKI